MVIKRLRLHNFGIYAGDNEFLFQAKKPIVLIGGMNGRGKTTFLEAVMLALYGNNSVAYGESGQKSYLQYLRSFVNRSASDKKCSVELEFEINNGVKESYIIKREWNAINQRTKEVISVYKDDIENEFLTNNWSLFIENILPNALANFFFFDGEKIAELAVDNTNNQLKNAIRSMLGISVLDVLSNDILRNLKRLNKNIGSEHVENEIQKLRDDEDNLSNTLGAIDVKIKEINQKFEEKNRKLENLHHSYIIKGGGVVEKEKEIIQKRTSIMAEISNVDNRIYELISGELPLLMVRDLITDIKLQATDEHMDLVMTESVVQLDNMFKDFILKYDGDKKAGIDFFNFVKNSINENQTEIIFGLSDQAIFQINNLIEGVLVNVEEETRLVLDKKRNFEKQIEEIDSYLTLDINDSALQKIHSEIKKTEKQIINYQIQISDLEQKLRNTVFQHRIVTSDLRNKVESYLLNEELKDISDRTRRYSNMALNIIERFRIELQKRKTDLLSDTITKCYLQLANKKNLINQVIMDHETLDIKYLSKDNVEISKYSLSAGEQQLIVISILWGLSICSKKKLPIIIDTPLARLDSEHRKTLLTKYFPKAGEQIIILSTDSEIDEAAYCLIKDNVSDKFILEYDEKTHSTTIKKGYLSGDAI